MYLEFDLYYSLLVSLLIIGTCVSFSSLVFPLCTYIPFLYFIFCLFCQFMSMLSVVNFHILRVVNRNRVFSSEQLDKDLNDKKIYYNILVTNSIWPTVVVTNWKTQGDPCAAYIY